MPEKPQPLRFHSTEAAKNFLCLISSSAQRHFTMVVNVTNDSAQDRTSLMGLDNFGENGRKKDFETGFEMPPAGHVPSFMKQTK